MHIIRGEGPKTYKCEHTTQYTLFVAECCWWPGMFARQLHGPPAPAASSSPVDEVQMDHSMFHCSNNTTLQSLFCLRWLTMNQFQLSNMSNTFSRPGYQPAEKKMGGNLRRRLFPSFQCPQAKFSANQFNAQVSHPAGTLGSHTGKQQTAQSFTHI